MSSDSDEFRHVAKRLRRRGLKRLAQARATLAQGASDVAVHDARKRLKEARAIVRSLRGAAGRGTARRAERAVRKAGRSLGVVRDADVAVATFDALFARSTPESRRPFLAFRAALVARRRAAHEDVAGQRPFRHALAQATRRVDALHIDSDGWSSVLKAWRSMYRDARRAFRRATDNPDDDDAWHGLRKRAKRLCNAIEAVEVIDPTLARLTARLKALGGTLGVQHDLAMLRGLTTDGSTTTLDARVQATLAARIDRRQQTLRARSRRSAEALLREKPSAFTTSLYARWLAFVG